MVDGGRIGSGLVGGKKGGKTGIEEGKERRRTKKEKERAWILQMRQIKLSLARFALTLCDFNALSIKVAFSSSFEGYCHSTQQEGAFAIPKRHFAHKSWNST